VPPHTIIAMMTWHTRFVHPWLTSSNFDIYLSKEVGLNFFHWSLEKAYSSKYKHINMLLNGKIQCLVWGEHKWTCWNLNSMQHLPCDDWCEQDAKHCVHTKKTYTIPTMRHLFHSQI